MISVSKLRGPLLVGVLVLAGLAVGLSPAANAGTPMGTPNRVRTEGSDSDPVIIVDPRRGAVGTTVRVTARCGPPLTLIHETFHRPANFEVPTQPELEGSDPHFFVPPADPPNRFQFSGNFEVPATLFDPVLYRSVPVLPGRYVVDVRCDGATDARGYVNHIDLRAVFCVPDCPPLGWERMMSIHLGAASWRLEALLQVLIPPPITTTTTTRPRSNPPQPSPPPPPVPTTQPTTTTTLCPNGKEPPCEK